MPIINPNPSPADRLAAQAQGVRSQINRQYRDLTSLATQTAAFIWQNPSKATPQQVFDAFGTDAGDLVKLTAAFVALITAITGTAPNLVPPGVKVTVNSDNTVTVS